MSLIGIKEMQMETMLRLQAGLGKNYFKDKRVLILNAKAIGILRKDLIYTLGIEKAKGFLIRFGFNNGYQDFENSVKNLPRNAKNDRYQMAINFHRFIGMANVTPHLHHRDDANHTWTCEGTWHDSYEAEHHLRHFGSATEPVCWTLVGYASGIMSALFGERVIIKEVSCAAMGDQCCRYVGKKLSDWGEEITPELQYYHGTTLGHGTEWPHTSIQEQNEALKQLLAIHEQLTRMVLNGEEISTITSMVGRIMGATLIVEDHSFQPVAYYSPTISTKKNPTTQAPFSTKDIIGDWRLRHLANTLIQEKKPVRLPAELTRKTVSQFIYPIEMKQEVLGYVSVFKPVYNLTEHERMTMEYVNSVFALKMMQDRTVAKTETRLIGDYVVELIEGNFKSEASIIERARCIGYNLKLPHHVLVVEQDRRKGSSERYGRGRIQDAGFKEQICEAINRELNIYNKSGTVTTNFQEIIMLVALEKNGTSAATTELARNIQKLIAKQFSVTVSIGIGRVCYKPRDFSRSYQEAQWSLKVIRGLNQENMVISFENLGTFGLLFNAANHEDLLNFMQGQLGKLLEYDTKYNSQLVESLHHYFNCNGNIKEAAEAAALTISGFKYRLKKLCEVGSFTLKDPNKKFDLQLALKIWCLIKGN